MTFAVPVVTAPVKVGRSGAVLADGWLPEPLFWRVAGPLVARLARERPEPFAGRVFLMDRKFLGYHLITAILDAGGNLIMRVKAAINLPTASRSG